MLGVILLSILVGVLLTILFQWLFIRHWFYRQPILNAPWKSQADKFYLPREIQEALKDMEQKKKKESCLCLNLLFQFLFQELKDTQRIRRWVMSRLNLEFAEMLQTTTGKLLDQITVRDFSLGQQFPIVRNVCIQNTAIKEETMLDELSLLLDLVYKGGFQLAVDVDMVFGKSAYLSVKVTKIQGRGRLQFTRVPFTHWSFSFVEDPIMEFEVESHFEGRPVPQITSLIVNQIRRSIRKKHTLPNYKIRHKPFFVKPEPLSSPPDIYYQGSKLSMGHLSITVVECNRLVKVFGGAYVYATLALDSVPWLELMSSRRKLWVAHDIDIIRGQGQNIGLSFKDDYILDRYEEMVVVDIVTPNTPAAASSIRKGDVVVAVNGSKVTNTKQAAKLMKQTTDKLALRIERPSSLKGLPGTSSSPEFKFEEDTVSLKDSEIPEDPEPLKDESDDYINITLTSLASSSPSTSEDKPKEKEVNGYEGNLDDITLPGSTSSPSKKAFAILSSTGLFHRKQKSQVSADENQDIKAKVTSPINISATEQTSKKFKEVPIPACVIKEKGKDLTAEKLDIPAQVESVNTVTDCLTVEEQLSDYNSVDLKKTQFLTAAEDVKFNEKFEFDIDESHNYLNVCVWCKIPEKLDKQSRVIKPEKDILLGHVSIPLMDVALESLATLQGDLQMTYKLTPAEMKAGASRNKVSNLSVHPGFDEKLCYGDITLEFTHTHAVGPFSKLDRDNISKMRVDSELNEAVNPSKTNGLNRTQPTIKREPPEEGKHDFIGTHFQAATYCNFCHKKIWLKTAFQCQVCGMVCHKKCTERCQAQTTCSKKGFQIKEPPSMLFRKSMKEEKETVAKDSKDTKESKEPKEAFIKDTASGTRASFLSKFRKERGGSDQGSKALTVGNALPKSSRRPSSPEPMSLTHTTERKRHNSAPDEDHLSESANGDLEQPITDRLLKVTAMPRPKSSASIGDIIRSKVSPSVRRRKKTAAAESSPDVSASEDDTSMRKIYERQRAVHSTDELVVTAAKEMGKELYVHLSFEERREKLDSMIIKLQHEIDLESECRAELCRQEKHITDPLKKANYKNKIEKSDEKVQSLALLMLHYCAGLQHCMEEQELDRQRKEMGVIEEGVGVIAEEASGVVINVGGTLMEVGGAMVEVGVPLNGMADREGATGQYESNRAVGSMYLHDGILGEDDGTAADDESSNEESGQEVDIQEDSEHLEQNHNGKYAQIDMVEDPTIDRVERFMSLIEEAENLAAESMTNEISTNEPLAMSFQALLSQHDSDSDTGRLELSREVLTPHSFVSCDSDKDKADSAGNSDFDDSKTTGD